MVELSIISLLTLQQFDVLAIKKPPSSYHFFHYNLKTISFKAASFLQGCSFFIVNAFWCKKKALHSLQRASIRKETVPEGTVSYYSTGNLREIYANAFAPAALASAANLGSPNSGLCRFLATIRVPVPYAHSSGGLIISAPDPLITLPFSSLESFIHL